MTPDEYAAKRRAYDRARYIAQRPERLAKARAQYQGNGTFREGRKAYARAYEAGRRRERRAMQDAAATSSTITETP